MLRACVRMYVMYERLVFVLVRLHCLFLCMSFMYISLRVMLYMYVCMFGLLCYAI